jgi:chromosome partitioning protein
MINRKGRGSGVVVELEVLRELVDRVASLEQQLQEKAAAPAPQLPAARAARIGYGFEHHYLPQGAEESGGNGLEAEDVISVPAPDTLSNDDGEAQGPASDEPHNWPDTIPRLPNVVEAARSEPPQAWPDTIAQVASPIGRIDAPPAAVESPVKRAAPAPSFSGAQSIGAFEGANSFFAATGTLSVAPGYMTQASGAGSADGKSTASSTGPAPDIARLFAAFGLPSFKYREVAMKERAARVSATAEMMGSPVVAPEARIIADAMPMVMNRPLTVAVVGLSRGVGRTTVAANLAATLSQRVARTVVIGLDPKNDLSVHFGGDNRQVGVINRATSLDRLRSVKSGTVCLPFGSTATASVRELEGLLSENSGWLEERLLPMAINASEIWVLDTPGDEGFLLDNALALADIVVIVTTSDPDDLSAMARLDDRLRSEAVRSKRLPPYLLLNRFDSRRDLDRAAQASLSQHWGGRLVPVALHEDVVVQKATAARTLVVQAAPNSQVTADFTALADWLRTRKPRSRRDSPRMVRG